MNLWAVCGLGTAPGGDAGQALWPPACEEVRSLHLGVRKNLVLPALAFGSVPVIN